MLRRILIAALILLLLPAMLVLGLVGTQAGSRWLVKTGSGLVPGLTVRGVQGTLAGDLSLDGIAYSDASGLRVELDRLSLSWEPMALLHGQLYLGAVRGRGLLLALPKAAAEAQEAGPVSFPSLDVLAPLSLRLDVLDLQQGVIRQNKEQWNLKRLTLGGGADRDGLRVRELLVEGEGARLAASGTAAGAYPYRLAIQADWQAKLPDTPPLAGRGTISGDITRLDIEQRIRAPYALHITGSLEPDLENGRHRFDVAADWAELAVPVAEGDLFSRQGKLTVKGESAAYTLTFTSRFRYPGIDEDLDLDLTGQGDLAHIQIAQARLQGLGGTTRLSGRFGWNPALTWQAKVQASSIDPGRIREDWPGSLNLDMDVQGGVASGVLKLDADIRRLDGDLREYPVAGHGRVSLVGDKVAVDSLQLRSGENRIQMDGSVYPAMQLSFDVDAAELRQLAPMLSGSLQGQGRLQGSVEELAARINLQGRRLDIADLSVAELTLEADIDPANASKSHFSVRAKTLAYDDLPIDALDITGTGNIGRHQLRIGAQAADGDLDMRLAGGYNGKRWRGEFSALTLNGPSFGRWQLEKPFALQAGTDQVRLDTLCLAQAGAQGRLCAEGRRSKDGSLSADGRLNGLSLGLLEPLLAGDTSIDGDLSGSFGVRGKPPRLQAEAELQLSPGSLRYTPATGPALVADHRDGQVRLDYRNDALQTRFGIKLGDAGVLEGTGSLGSDSGGTRALQGELKFSLPDPRPLAALVPQLSDWSGPMRMRARLDGTLQQPTVQLDGSWSDGQVKVPDLGIALSEIQVGLQGDGKQLRLQGQAMSGGGRVEAKGKMDLHGAAPWPLHLHLEGKDFSVARRSDLEVKVSPLVDVEVTGQEISATGRIDVPYARIEVQDIPNAAVRVSPDQVIVDHRAPEGGKAGPKGAGGPRTRARLRLVLGDDVRLKAYGLETRLTGDLELHQEPDTPVEAIGQLHLQGGRYKAYGQDLTIEQGRLLFAGPLSAAGVDIRAVRKVGDVTAGISLTGTLTSPAAQLFSTPPMEEANILSYIVRGAPLSEKKEMDRNALIQAAANFGLDKTTPVTAQLAADLGLDELGVAEGGSGLESTAMAIGKRISPDLYLRYLYGLFDNTSAVQLRYTLSEHLKLEGTAGQQQAVDLIYEKEKD